MGVPEKLSSDDCLVIIKTTVTNPDDHPVARRYSLRVTGNDNKIRIMQGKDSFIYVLVKNDEYQIETMHSVVVGNNWKGKPTEYQVGISLPYEPGKLIIADVGFDLNTNRIKRHEYMSEPSFFDVSEEEKENLLEKLKGRGDFSDWL